MITGKIQLYEEPVRYTPPTTTYHNYRNYGGFGGMYQDDSNDTWNTNSKLSADEQEKAVLLAASAGTMLGFTQGARVKRAAGFGKHGTIIHIHRSYTMAYNHSSGLIEPFKVQWDAEQYSSGGTYDYSMDDLVLVEEAKQLPVLLQGNKEQQNESIPDLC
jgi:hypothetical protein